MAQQGTRAAAASLASVAAALACAPPALGADPSGPTVRAAAIEQRIAAGGAVSISNRTVVGPLRFPSEVHGPVTLHHVTLLGRLDAASTSFDKLVDLGGTTVRRGASFAGASFAGPAVFRGLRTAGGASLRFDFAAFRSSALFGDARLSGPVTFADSVFGGTTRFRAARFGGPANFESASFGSGADFSDSTFGEDARFSSAEFRSVADFSAAEFDGRAVFAAARFSEFATFIGATFGAASSAAASFQTARFDAGATFLAGEFDGPVNFELVQSAGDMIFDGAELDRGVSFSTARLLGATTFAQSRLYGFVNFDQAAVNRLDLDGASFESDGARVALPQPEASTAHLGELRFDPDDVGHIGIGSGPATDAQREDGLGLVEAAALRGGDARAANEARLRLWTIKRGDRQAILRAGDWVAMWGIGGYLVRPWHQVLTIAALIVLLTAIRVLLPLRKREPRASPRAAFAASFAAFWRLKIHEGSGWDQAEATLYKLLLVVLLLNLANVWPTGHDLVKGIFG